VKLSIELPGDRPVVVLGAHADDIEIGAGGTLLQLSHDHPESRFLFAVAASDTERSDEALASARDLLGDRAVVQMGGFEDGFLPYADPTAVKRWLRSAVGSTPPALVFSPWGGDEHQDHRFMGQLAWQIFRGSTILEYEIPKWESEPFVPNLLIPVSEETARAKLDHLEKSFPSQHGKPWYDISLFSSTLRARGVQHGASINAEGFVARKLALEASPQGG
jgi:LmbE family N-acetylglucosaminyl deacetylase